MSETKVRYQAVRNALKGGTYTFSWGDEPMLLLISLNPFEDEEIREMADAFPQTESLLALLDQAMNDREGGPAKMALARQVKSKASLLLRAPPEHRRIGASAAPYPAEHVTE